MTAELADRQHFVYELLDAAGGHVYVGCTSNLAARLADHAASKDWFTDVTRVEADLYPNQRSALDAERERIELYQPTGNSIFTDGHDAGGWQKRKASTDLAHAAGRPCGYASCRQCRKVAHDLGVKCPKYGCPQCANHMPIEYLGSEVQTACWDELVRRHGAEYAFELCWHSESALEALSFDEAGVSLEVVREDRMRALSAAVVRSHRRRLA